MAGESPAAVLFDVSGNQVGIILDAPVYRLQTEAKLAAGTAVIGVVSQGDGGASPWLVTANALPLPSGASTEVTLATRAAASQLPVALVGGRLDVNIGASALPAGAATEITLSGVLTTSVFETRINTLGQKTMSASMPVVLASDQTAIAVSGPVTNAELRATPVPVSGTVTANIGTSGSLALNSTLTGGTAKTRITDGTNDAAVKAASTAAVAADKALVVAVSPNNYVGIRQDVIASAGNSYIAPDSGPPLVAGGTWVGAVESALGVAGIQINCYSDVPSAYDGLVIEQSMTGIDTEFYITDAFVVRPGEGFSQTIQAAASYFRVRYTNGSQNQLVFQLQTVLCPVVEVLPRSLTTHGNLKTSRLTLEKHILTNSFLDTNGEAIVDGFVERTTALIINIKDSPSMGATLQFHMAGVDPGDKGTLIANAWDSDVFTNSGYQVLTFPSIYSNTFKISWTVTGTWTGVYLTVVEKATADRGVTRTKAGDLRVNQSAASVLLQPVDFNRGSGSILNNSDATLFLKFSGAASLTDYHIRLTPYALYEMQPGEYRSVYGIWDAAGAGKAMISVGY